MCKLKIGICLFYDFFGYILSGYYCINYLHKIYTKTYLDRILCFLFLELLIE